MRLRLRDLFWILPASLGLGLVLALLDGGLWWTGWLAYTLLLTLGLLAIAALWRSAGAPRTLAWVLLLTVFLRLGLGVGLAFILPVAGSDTESQRAGYIYKDAHQRDTQAWRLATSGVPLWQAFEKRDSTGDQYGGLLAVSALVYRLFSPDHHRPWLVVLLGALTAGIGVALAWKAAYQVWESRDGVHSGDARMAGIVVWILALYPESILQGASQMREPFLVAFTCMAFWGLVALPARSAWTWLAGGLLGMLLFSPVIAVVTMVGLGAWSWLRSSKRRFSWRAAALGMAVLAAGLILMWFAVTRGNLAGATPQMVLRYPLATVGYWLHLIFENDLYYLEQSSGWLQRIFSEIPEQYRMPFMTLTGLIQPILPGTIFDPTVWPWQMLNILRSAGWYALMPFLAFSLIAVRRITQRNERLAWIWLWLVSVGWIILSSLRAAGDQWDNPRYRAILLLFQALLAALAWASWRESRNPWLGRILAIEGIFLTLFGYWYLVRSLGWTAGVVHVFVIVGAIVFLSSLVIVAGWVGDWKKTHRRA